MADGNIFISYRRGADSNAAGRLYDRLERNFDHQRLFFDIDSIPLGVDFAEHIDGEVAKCDVQLVVIGPGWLEEVARLADPDDFVRIEIEAALKRPDIPVVPVLLEGAEMPATEDLPESLRSLVRRNAIVLGHAHFAQTVDGRLSNELDGILAATRRAEGEAERERQAREREEAKRMAKETAEAEMAEADADREGLSGKGIDEGRKLEEREEEPQARATVKSGVPRKRFGSSRIVPGILAGLAVLAGGAAIFLREPYYNFGRYLNAAETISANGVEFQKVGEGLCREGGAKPAVISTYFNQSLSRCATLCAMGKDCLGFSLTIQQSEKVDIRDCELFASRIDRIEATRRDVYCYNLN